MAHVIGRAWAEEGVTYGGAVGPLGAGKHFAGHKIGHCLAQYVLLGQAAQAQVGRYAGRKLHHAVVKEGEAPLHGVGHGHSIALRGQQVLRQEDAAFDELRPRQGVPAHIYARKGLGQLMGTVAPGLSQLLFHPPREQALDACRTAPAHEVAVARVSGLSKPVAEEGFQVGAGGVGHALHVSVQPPQQQGPEPRIGVGGPETAQFILFEDVIPAQKLVGPLAGEHHLEAVLPDQPRQQKHGHGGGAQYRRLHMPHHIGEVFSDLLVGAVHRHMLGAQMVGHALLVGRFVKVLIGEGDGEGLEPVARVTPHDGRYSRRVEAAAQVGPHGHVSAQAQARGVHQQFEQAVRVILLVVALASARKFVREVERPVPAHTHRWGRALQVRQHVVAGR